MGPGHSSRDDAADRIEAQARVVGLRDVDTATLDAIDRRRLELWILTTIVVGAVGLGMFLITGWADVDLPFPTAALRAGIVALALAFCAYAMEKEVHLRRLTRMLLDERLLTEFLSTRVSELKELLAASRAMNSVLDVEEVLQIILASAVDILRAESGSIMLAEESELRTISALGNPNAASVRIRFGEGIAGHVAEIREPMLITGHPTEQQFSGVRDRERPVRSAICVPLINRGDLLGVLNVNARQDASFNEHDLRALSVFAEQAAVAIANARLYQAEQDRVHRLQEVDRMKREFISAINHDLRTPLTILLGGANIARRPDLPAEERDRFLSAIERQGHQLAAMIDALLVTAELERDPAAGSLGMCDAAEVARSVAEDLRSIERDVAVEAPVACPVVGRESTIQRILSNLVDNAFKHGAPPVEMKVRRIDGAVEIVVADRGPGIPEEHREKVFDRFFRLDPNRSQPGMGLGMSIVRSLAEGCGGSVSVVESPGGGTAVRVLLDAPPEFAAASDESATTVAESVEPATR